MEVISAFAVISIIVFLGFIAEQIFKRFNIPDVMFLIIIGIVFSTVLKWVDVNKFGDGINLFTTFALIFILFQGALNIEFKTLFKTLSSTFKLTILNFILTVAVIAGIIYYMGYDIYLSILMGLILGGTSSAVVIPLVSNIEIKEKYGLVLSIESALSDVLCIIGTVTILELIETQQIIVSSIFRNILASFSLALTVGFIVGLMWIFVMAKYEILIKADMVTIAILMALYAFVESSFVQASGAIAALSFGLVLGNSKIFLNMNNKKDAKTKSVLGNSSINFYSEISFFVKTFFFVYLGMLIDFSNWIVFLFGLLLTIAIYLIRPFAVYLAFRKDKLLTKERTLLEVLIPKGLAAAVLIGVAVQNGVFGSDAGFIINLVLSVIFISILFTSFLVFLSEKEIFKGLIPLFYNKDDVKNVKVSKRL